MFNHSTLSYYLKELFSCPNTTHLAKPRYRDTRLEVRDMNFLFILRISYLAIPHQSFVRFAVDTTLFTM